MVVEVYSVYFTQYNTIVTVGVGVYTKPFPLHLTNLAVCNNVYTVHCTQDNTVVTVSVGVYSEPDPQDNTVLNVSVH